jgi:hypothetical protein
METVLIEVWIAESTMVNLVRYAQAEGISAGTLAGRRLAEAFLSLPLRQGLSSEEVITLYANRAG